ncbi:hypothetical protein ACLB1N_20350 [Escherichia coli]
MSECPTSLAITGTPLAEASTTTMPNGSLREGITISDAARQTGAERNKLSAHQHVAFHTLSHYLPSAAFLPLQVVRLRQLTSGNDILPASASKEYPA